MQSHSVNYTTRRSVRAKALKVTVYPDGRVVLTIPKRRFSPVSTLFIERFVALHAVWIQRMVERLKKQSTHVKQPQSRSRDAYLKHKEAARVLVHARLPLLNEVYGFSYKRVSIKDLRTRWGSCSRKGNLNFNYRILELPQHLRDYIIVHELCHLKEFNHSKNFWDLVAQSLPAYKALRKELRVYGM